jgi:hypothetical protein
MTFSYASCFIDLNRKLIDITGVTLVINSATIILSITFAKVLIRSYDGKAWEISASWCSSQQEIALNEDQKVFRVEPI